MIIQFELSEAYLSDELENYVTKICANIVDMDEAENTYPMGEIQATYVNISSAFDEGECVFDVFDHDSQTLYENYEALFSEQGEIYQFLAKNTVEYGWPYDYRNILFIDLIEIKPEYRGRRLGLAALYRVLQKFMGGCRFAFIKVFPLQFRSGHSIERSNEQLKQFTRDKKAAVRKLKNYYSKIGFKRIPNSDYMLFDNELRHPPFSKIGYKDI